MKLDFNNSKEYTLGIELEVQLVDRESYALAPLSDDLLLGTVDFKKSIKHELMTSNIEVNTGVCNNIKEAETDLKEKLQVVYAEASKRGALIALSGSHPFSSWREQAFSKDERYNRLIDKLQIVARRFNIFGLHVHVGIGDGEKCIYIMNRLLYYLPHFLSLSASSPFWNGEYTGLNSYRSKVFETLPTAGLPFYFEGWKDYSTLVERYIETGTIETIREIWWDVRPHPDFGTLELRICDTPASLKDVISISALIQALVAMLGSEYDKKTRVGNGPSWIIRENKWRASRYGLDGEFITEDGSGTLPVRESIRSLLSRLEEYSAQLDSFEQVSGIEDILEKGNGAWRHLDIFRREGSLPSVVKELSGDIIKELKG